MAQHDQLLEVLDHSKHSEEQIVKCCECLTPVFFLLYATGFPTKLEYWDGILICISGVTYHFIISCGSLAS